MTDFLTNLAARAVTGQIPTAKPFVSSVFAPAREYSSDLLLGFKPE